MSDLSRRGLIAGTGGIYPSAIVGSEGAGKTQLAYRRGPRAVGKHSLGVFFR
jgi:hypothetical protein